MNPRISSIENLIASDPGERNIFGLVVADQLRLAVQSLSIVDSDPQGSGTRGVRLKGGPAGQVRYEGNIPTFHCG